MFNDKKNVRAKFIAPPTIQGSRIAYRSRMSNEEPHVSDYNSMYTYTNNHTTEDIYRYFILTPIYEFARF